MKKSITIVLTFPIVPKKNSKIPRVSSRGKPYLQPNPRAVDSEDWIKMEASIKWHGKPFSTPVKMTLEALKMSRMRSDLSGVLETVQDALNEIAYDDDRLIHEISARWMKKQEMQERTGGPTATAFVTVKEL